MTLVSLNIAINLLITLFPLYWTAAWLKLPVLNPISIISIINFPFAFAKLVAPILILSEHELTGLNLAIFHDNIYGIFGILNLLFFYKTGLYRSILKLVPLKGQFSQIDFKRLSNFFLILFVIVFTYLMLKTGGVMDWVTNIRESYMAKREGNGVYFAAAMSFLSLAFFFRITLCTNRLYLLSLTGLYFSFGYLFGTKGFLLQILTFSLSIYIIKFPRHSKVTFFLAIPSILFILLINFFGGTSSFEFTELVKYFNYYYNAAIYYTDYVNQRIMLYGGEVIISSLWSYVPRGIFPEKPYVYGILHIVEHYYPGGPESGNTPAFAGQVARFADFGYPGLFILSLLNFHQVILYALATKIAPFADFMKNRIRSIDSRVLLCMVVVLAPGYGTFLSLMLFVLFTMLVLLTSKFVKIMMKQLARI